MTGFRRGIDPPFWWKPWLRLYWIKDWWHRPRPVRPVSLPVPPDNGTTEEQ